MSLTAITRAEVETIVRPSELPGLFADESQILSIIESICDKVVMAVNSGGYWATLKTGRSKVPPELVHTALVLVRHACIAKAPGSSISNKLEGSPRSAEYRTAVETLQAVAEGALALNDYTIGADPEDLVPAEEQDGSVSWGCEPVMDTNILFMRQHEH